MMEDDSGGRYERRPEGFGKKFCFCFVCVLREFGICCASRLLCFVLLRGAQAG